MLHDPVLGQGETEEKKGEAGQGNRCVAMSPSAQPGQGPPPYPASGSSRAKKIGGGGEVKANLEVTVREASLPARSPGPLTLLESPGRCDHVFVVVVYARLRKTVPCLPLGTWKRVYGWDPP